jgi:hypothetical protein
MARSNTGATPVNLFQLTVDPRNVKRVSADNSGVAGYVQLFNSVAAPVNGAVPESEKAIAAGPSNATFDFNESGERYTRGLWAALSTTPNVLTLGGATCWFEAEYY